MPELVLIDGGKGQLDAALKALEERNVQVPIISIAKREEEVIVHKTRSSIDVAAIMKLAENPVKGVQVTSSGEYFIVNLHAGQINASSHSKNLRGGSVTNAYSDVVKLFQRIRDESHRFAVSYHTVLKRQKQTASVLEEIPGIGPTTRRKLIREFGSVRGVQAADEAALIASIGQARATVLRKYLPPQ